jgi:hypothetical protein
MEVYARCTLRYIEDRANPVRCLDVANVNVRQTGRGRFTQFLSYLEQHNPCPLLYVENVHSKRFMMFFVRRGYATDTHVGRQDGPPSFYKRCSNGQKSHAVGKAGQGQDARQDQPAVDEDEGSQ